MIIAFPLMVASLTAQISATGDGASLRFTTPGAGCYAVVRSCDLLQWQCVATGHVRVASHVTARLDTGAPCEFYAVGWIATP